MSEPSRWREIVAEYQTPSVKRALWQLGSTLVPLLALFVAMHWSMQVSYWLTLALAVPAAGLTMRSFVIMHDCGHGSFLPSRRWNDIVGWATGILTATPYAHWRREHAIHHATTGHLQRRGTGDITTMTVSEYLQASRLERLQYRFYRNPFTLLVLGPLFVFVKHRWPARRIARTAETVNVHLTNLAIAALVTTLSLCIGFTHLLLLWLPTFLMTGAAGIFLFYVQHQFEHTYWRDDADWDYASAAVAGSSYYQLPRLLQWFTGNIGFHHVHHLSPRIPNYRLERCHKDNPPLQQVTTITLWQSVRTLGLKLWDEQSGRMVGFGEIRRAARRHAAG